MWLPGWDSIEATHKWDVALTWLGFFFLFLMLLCEVVARLYVGRREELVAAVEAQKASELQARSDAAESRAASLEQAQSELARRQAPRRLASDQRKALVEALAPFKGQRVRFMSVLGDAEGKQFRDDLIAALEEAGWVRDGPDAIGAGVYEKNPEGIEVTVNAQEVAANRTPASAATLVLKLYSVGLIGLGPQGKPHLFTNEAVPANIVEVRIGPKKF